MSDQDPARLKSSGETPAELVRALQALGRDRDAERLARVAERLGSSLGGGASATTWLRGASGAKWLIGLGLGVGAAALIAYAVLSTRVRNEAVRPPAGSGVESTAQPAVLPATTGAAGARSPEPTLAPIPSVTSAPQRVRTTERKPAARNHEHGGSPASSERTGTPAPGAGARPASSVAARTPAAALEPSIAPEAEAAAVAAPRPSPAKPLPSEVALLHQARKVAADDPERALRVLDEHARRFPSGLLVPERELLAIEVLRRLERNAEADRRVKQFGARYPGSIHRRRLERAGSGAEH